MKEENKKFKELNEKLAHIVRRIYLEQFPGTYFTCGQMGEVDESSLPPYIMVCPAYDADWSAVYKKEDRAIGGVGS